MYNDLPEHLIKDIEFCKIEFPAMLPLFSSPPSMPYLQAWANSQLTPKLIEIAHFIVNNINYVSFEKFLLVLKQTINDFNEKITDNHYVLVIGESEQGKLKKGCSDQWVTALAIEQGLKHPVRIITENNIVQFLKENTNINNILFLDDASYSCEQKSAVMTIIEASIKSVSKKYKNYNVYVGIPFLTNHAFEELNNYNASDVMFCKILFHEKMPSIHEILNMEYIFYLKTLQMSDVYDTYTFTYFDHKFPDYMSCSNIFKSGNSMISHEGTIKIIEKIINRSDDNIDALCSKTASLTFLAIEASDPFLGYNIPIIIEPYKLRNEEYKQELKVAIEKDLVGEVRGNIPESYKKFISDCKKIKRAEKIADYKISTMPSEKQKDLDESIATKIADIKRKALKMQM